MGEWVEIQGPDGAFKAYVARPSGTPKGAVVVIQEIFGVNAVMRGKADWLAREGFLAVRRISSGGSSRASISPTRPRPSGSRRSTT